MEKTNRRLVDVISITSPSAFKQSMLILSKGGLSNKEKKDIVLAKERAKTQLRRKNLTQKERYDFNDMILMNLGEMGTGDLNE